MLQSAEYYCIGETANVPAFQDVLSKEWLWWGVQYNDWKQCTVDVGRAVPQLRDDPCGTPVECYDQAIKALREAEQKILSLQTGLSSLNQTVIANQKQVIAMNASIVANISATGCAVSSNTNTITANTDSINTNAIGII